MRPHRGIPGIEGSKTTDQGPSDDATRIRAREVSAHSLPEAERRDRVRLLRLVLICLFLGAVLLRAAFVPDAAQPALLVPSSGVVVAGLAMLRKRTWRRVVAVAVVLELLVVAAVRALAGGAPDGAVGLVYDLAPGGGLLALLAFGGATAAEAWVGASLLRRGRGRRGEEDGLRAFVAFSAAVIVGGALGAAVQVVVEGTLFAAQGVAPAERLLALWRARSLGVVLVAPAVLAFSGLWRPVRSEGEPGTGARSGHTSEWFAWSLAFVLCVALVLTRSGATALPGTRAYLLLPPLFWAALRFDLRTASAALFVLGSALLCLSAQGLGPFGAPQYSLADGAFAAHAFLLVAGATTLLGGAAVADRRRSEDERHRLAARLERVRELSAVGRLAQHVAAELQTDLTMARAGGERLLRERRGDPVVDEGVGMVSDALGRAEQAVTRLFTLGLRVGRKPPPVALDELTGTVLDQLRQELRPSTRLTLHAEPDLPPVRIGLRDLEGILGDLVANAEAASPDGATIHLRIERTHVDRHLARRLPHLREGTYVALEVEDAGHGLEPDLQKRAFEPGTTTRRDEGAAGLGLPAVRATAESLGGAAELRSEPGRGTRALVLLPPAGEVGAGSGEIRRDPARSGTVLVVEDEKATRDFLLHTLEGGGYEVLVAPEGEAAIELAVQRPGRVELILIDIDLPGRDGISVADELLQLLPSARVLFISGAFATAPARAALVHSSGFLAKPFTAGDLLRAVRRVLRGRTRVAGETSRV